MSFIQKQGQNTAWQRALMRNLATDFVKHEKLVLSYRRAKTLQRHIEHLITTAKKQTLHSRRRVAAFLRPGYVDRQQTQTPTQKLCDVLAKRYRKRPGGYTRVVKTNNRRGDGALLGVITFVTATVPRRR